MTPSKRPKQDVWTLRLYVAGENQQSRLALQNLTRLCAQHIGEGLYEIEVIDLRFRTADQVLPVLQPLLEPGGALSGQGSQLFLRTSRANAAQIRQVLATLDRPPRQLEIRVRQDMLREGSSQQRNADGSVTITSRRTFGKLTDPQGLAGMAERVDLFASLPFQPHLRIDSTHLAPAEAEAA